MDNSYKPGDYNRGGMIAFAVSMIFTLAFFVYISLIHRGVDLKELPEEGKAAQTPAAEQAAAGTEAGAAAEPAAGVAAAPAADAAQAKDPWVTSAQLVSHGQSLFQTNCAVCHGTEGKGDGPGSGTVPKPRNLVEGKWKRGGTSEALFVTLTEGFAPGSSMISFSHLPVNDRWALVHYVRSITQNKPEDDAEKLAAFAQKAK